MQKNNIKKLTLKKIKKKKTSPFEGLYYKPSHFNNISLQKKNLITFFKQMLKAQKTQKNKSAIFLNNKIK